MLIRISQPGELRECDVTDQAVYHGRRRFIKAALAGTAGLLLPATLLQAAPDKLSGVRKTAYDPGEALTPYADVTTYNNFYEFGTDKESPARLAGSLRTKPWTVAVSGECGRPGSYALEDIVRPHQLEERIYRLRCVEGWSMVIPWVGISLASVLKGFEPNSRAKYVEFTTLHDTRQMPGQRRGVLAWPYVEGLRMDEALNPLALLAVGLYGEELLNQNGAPLRLVVPWKYGFKSIKSIVSIRFVERQPTTSWMRSAPREYGFYANVNPSVDHPRWSQAKERRIGELFKRETLMFNGYGREVAHLYRHMDLARYY